MALGALMGEGWGVATARGVERRVMRAKIWLRIVMQIDEMGSIEDYRRVKRREGMRRRMIVFSGERIVRCGRDGRGLESL